MNRISVITRKVFYGLMFFFIVLGMNLGVVPASAQQTGEDLIAFSQIYSGVRVLRGPQDSTSMGFKLPAHWASPTGGELHLSFSVILYGTTVAKTINTNFKAIVQVSINKVDLGSVIVDKEGLQNVNLPIPLTVWSSIKPGGINDITIQFTSNDTCGGASILTIDSGSVLAVLHGTALPATDLRLLPWPIYQGSFYPDSVVIVVPDNPTSGTLNAALSVAAGLGRMTNGKLQLQTTVSSALSAAVMQTSNLIFIGKPGTISQLSAIVWPGLPDGDHFKISGATTDDGILQMVDSPWNQAKVVLWVSGTNDTGIVKAGEAFGSGLIRTGVQSNLAIISDANLNINPDTPAVDTTLSELGYSEQLRLGEGVHSADYFLTIPYSQTAKEDGLLNLFYVNSALLDFGRSGFTVSVNGQNIGSGRFTERSTNISNVSIVIPRGTILPGINQITILETLKFTDICSMPLANDLWAVIRPESTIHIPLGTVVSGATSLNLNNYPAMFGPTLGRLAFVVSSSDPLGLGIAMDVAYDLGIKTEGVLINPELVYADDLNNLKLKERDILVIGTPTKLGIMKQLSSNMPAPFPAGSDIASEPKTELTFHLPAGTPSGYLEMFESPWNSERIVLTLLGNSESGLRSAEAALLTPALRSQLTGNLAVVYGEHVYSSIVAGQTTPQPITVVVPPTPIATATSSSVPSQTSLVVIGVLAVIVFVLAAVIIFLQRKRTPTK